MPDSRRPGDAAWSDDLFEDDAPEPEEAAPAAPARPFVQYIRETPAAPLGQGTKVLLWVAGVATGLLFAASLLRVAG